jgi:integrase
MAACGAVGRGFESLWAQMKIDSNPQHLRALRAKLDQNLTRKQVDRSLLSGESITLFRAAIRNAATRDPYERRLIAFLKKIRMNPDSFVNLSKNNPQAAEKKIISYIDEEVQRAEEGQITEITIRNPLKAIKVLLEMNDVSLNWKKIRRLLPPARGYALDRMPTLDEIRDILDVADARGKALTLMFLTSGLREGAIESLRISDYSPIYSDGKVVAGKIVVYNGDPERYITFVTPEALKALEKYLEFRRDHGEILGNQSPLFRDKFDPVKGKYGHGKYNADKNAIPMTAPAVRQYYNRLLYSVGIRSEKKRRHEFSVHGFRKFFKTRCELGGMKPINVETLMGHSTGISDSYYRPTQKDLLDDYLKVVDQLMINETQKLRAEAQEINKIKERENVNSDAISALSDQVMKLTTELERMKAKHLS